MSYSGDQIDSVFETMTGDLVTRKIVEERELIATYIEEQKFDAWLADVHGVWNRIVAGEIVAQVREVADAIRRGEYGR